MLDALQSFEAKVSEYEGLTGEVVGDSVKLAVIDSGASRELSTYLRLHTTDQQSYAEVRAVIRGFMASAEDTAPMDVGHVGGQGGNHSGNGKGANGKGKGATTMTKTKGKHNKGDSTPFEGYCGACGRWGGSASESAGPPKE